ncbi:MAG TPA: RimK/LysX family protein [Desulfuromonadales bacterium]|nr:RimK/LysX family protein [Desulfuromonadales bacterium]
MIYYRLFTRKILPVFLLAGLTLLAPAAEALEKRIVGATEVVTVEEAGLSFLGRMDTGAATTSIHAVDIEVAGPLPEGADCTGLPVAFTVVNEQGESCRLTARVEKTENIRTSEGKEERLFVNLTVGWQGEEKQVLVNLNDRSAMKYRLLLGRNWLENDFLVDVALR